MPPWRRSHPLLAARPQVLLQEYLQGDEWVVDTVSRDGEHKVLALWRYDKGEANGAPFVYFGIDARGVAGETERRLLDYAVRVLDAVRWRWGPCHIEVKMVPSRRGADTQLTAEREGAEDGGVGCATPVLVEINAGRWNGEEFQSLAEACYGHDMLEATLDAYLDPRAWRSTPSAPPAELAVYGKNVKLVSSVEGMLTAPPSGLHAEALDSLRSLRRFAPAAAEVGDHVVQTVDLNSCAGYCHLVHPDPRVISEDYTTLRGLQPQLFQVQ